MVQFRESDHSYTSDGEKYISMTTIVGKYKHKEDWDKIAENYAIKWKKNNPLDSKDKFTGDYWKNLWEANMHHSCGIGTRLHKKKEISNLGYIPIDSDLKVPIRLDYENLESGKYPELLIWNHDNKLAGQADLVIIESDGDKTYVDIIDFKSNKKLDSTSFRHHKTGHKMMQGCLKHLQCCHLSHYTLQLSGYAWMMEQYGFTPRNLIIEHYPIRDLDGEVDFEQNPVLYQLPYLKKEIVSMLKDYKKKNKC